MTPPSVKWADPSTAWDFKPVTSSPLFPLRRSGLALLEDPFFNDGISPSPILTGQKPLWRLNPLWNGNLAGPVILAQNGGAQKTPVAASAAPTVTPAAAPMSADQIWKLVMDSVALVESMDVTGKNMTVNGGIAGCRFPEFSLRSNANEDQKNCKVMFEANTHGLVNLQVRKVRGANESRITGFRLSYDKEVVRDTWPDSQVPVTGFHFIPAPDKSIPFYEEVDPPSFSGFGLKYTPTRAGVLEIPLIGFPLYKIFAEDSKKLEFTADYLSSWGLDDAAFYKDSHTQRYRIPQSVMDFFHLIRHADVDPPAWINLNNTHNKPSLFDWLSFENIQITAHLREGTLDIPNVGSFQLSRNKATRKLRPMYDQLQKLKSGCEYDRLFKEYTQLLDQTLRLEIRGDSKKIDATIFNPELPSLRFSNDKVDIRLTGLTAQTLNLELPPLRKLIDEIKKGVFNPKLHFTGIHADQITLTDKKTGISTTIDNTNAASLDLLWPGLLKIGGLNADKMALKQPSSGLDFWITGPKISSGNLQWQNGQSELMFSQVGGDKIHISYGEASFDANQSTLTNVKLNDGSAGTTLSFDSIESSGKIEYSLPSGEMSLSTSGKSKLTNLKMTQRINDAGETEVGADIGLAGTISKLSLKRGDKLSVDLSDSTISEGKLQVTARLSRDTDPKLTGLKYSLDAKIGKVAIDTAKLGPLTLSPSKVTNGTIRLTHDTWDLSTLPQMDISGTLDFHVDQFSGSGESFNLPGFSTSGTIKNIALQGDARVRWNQGDWSLEKPPSDNPKPLKLSAVLENTTVSQDPHQIKGTDLTSWAGNKVVRSEMKVNSAKFFIDDVEQIDFAPSDKAAQATSGLRKVSIKGLRFEEIDAGGVVWAKFPIFYYLRGLFPKIGTVGQGPDMKNSFLKLGGFEMKVEDNKPVTTFRDFSTELYEVGGRDQFAKVSIPLLIVSPFGVPLIDTGGSLIKVDVNLKDKLRGGSFHFESVPRPLEERRSRVVPVASTAK